MRTAITPRTTRVMMIAIPAAVPDFAAPLIMVEWVWEGREDDGGKTEPAVRFVSAGTVGRTRGRAGREVAGGLERFEDGGEV